jgi:hypothetical protein
MNAFDEYTRELVEDPKATIDASVVKAWLERELAEEGAAWVITEITDEFCSFGQSVAQDETAAIVLRALTADAPQAVVWYTLSDALRSVVYKAAHRKAEAIRFVDDFQRPLREAIDHYDAIGADRRALARGAK